MIPGANVPAMNAPRSSTRTPARGPTGFWISDWGFWIAGVCEGRSSAFAGAGSDRTEPGVSLSFTGTPGISTVPRFGSFSSRCMSLAINPAPPARLPLTAKLLLPGTASDTGPSDFIVAGSSFPRSRSAGVGSFGQRMAGPLSGASQAPPMAERNCQAESGSVAFIRENASSRVLEASLSEKYMASTTSKVSALDHSRGWVRVSR